jgi:hypothetical protein
MSEIVKNAVDFILERDEDGNLLNPYLNEMESDLFLKDVGDDAMNKYQEKLRKELTEAIKRVK